MFMLYLFVFATSILVLLSHWLYFFAIKVPHSHVTKMQTAQAIALLCINVIWTYHALKIVKIILEDMTSEQEGYQDELSSSEVEDN